MLDENTRRWREDTQNAFLYHGYRDPATWWLSAMKPSFKSLKLICVVVETYSLPCYHN